MKKKLLSLLLAAAMLLSLTPVFAVGTFKDVPKDSWYADAVERFIAGGFVKGVSDTEFAPGGTMTRAMLVTILSRIGGGVIPTQKSGGFSDVADSAWYAEPVAWAVENGITKGVSEKRFAPNDPITREQLAAFLWRYMDMRYSFDHNRFFAEQAFDDADPVSDWAQEAMRMMIGAGILKGRLQSGGKVLFDAKATCTRAEAVTMMDRMLLLELPDKEPETEPEPTESPKPVEPTAEPTEPPKPVEPTAKPTQTPAPVKPTPKPLPTPDPVLPTASPAEPMDAIADASLKLLRASHEQGKNTVVSPLSMLYALDLLAEGAEGRTLQELEQLFGLSTEQMTAALGGILENLQDGRSTIRCANSVWVNETCSLLPDYAARVQEKLQAQVRSLIFNDDAVKEMNAWINDQTDGLIPGALDRLDPDDLLVLINAILFKGNWNNCYSGTVQRAFHNADGTEQNVPMLQSVETTYLTWQDAIGFRKTFSGGRYSFAVLVPQKDGTPEQLLNSLDGETLREVLEGEQYDEVHTWMPKFKAETSLDLLDVLAAVDVRHLSELGGITGGAMNVSRGVHKAVIDVNESGVSAAAVTVIVTDKSAFPDPDRKIAYVAADRPYVYMIVDNQTMLPLFTGICSQLDG